MLYLHLLVGLITSKKYWILAKNLVPFLKRVIRVKFYLYEILPTIQTKEEMLYFIKA